MLRRAALVVATACLTGAGAAAQVQPPVSGPAAGPSPILTIDQDRLFAETRLGARSSSEIEAQAAALAEENRRIEVELAAEEQALTDDREGLTPEEFSALADAFDAKVQRIRAEQDAKARSLATLQDTARQRFFVEIGGVLSEIVRERGAVVILDRRDIFLSADSIDITDDAIARINAAAGPDTAPAGDQ